MNRQLLYYFVFLFLFWALMSWRDSTRPGHNKDERDLFEKEWWESYRNMTYQANSTHAQLPTTVRTAVDKLVLPYLERDEEKAEPIEGVFYRNISGIYHSEWLSAYVNETTPFWNGTLPEGYDRPDNSTIGKLTLVLDTDRSVNKSIGLLSGIARLRSGIYSASLRLQGLYWKDNGTAVMYGTPSESTQTVVDLVKSMPNNHTFAEAKAVFDEVYQHDLADYEQFNDVDHGCEYQVFLQFTPIKGLTHQELEEIEQELEHPTGRSIPKPPALQAQAILFSTNCSVAVSSTGTHVVGTRVEPYLTKATHYALASFVVLLAQMVLTIHQMGHTPTPSSISRVSYYTVAMMAVLDSYLCMLHLTGGAFYNEIYNAFSGVSFMSFALLTMFDMRYLAMIWNVQRPEAGNANTQEGRREMWLIYFRFYVVLIIGLFVIYMYTESIRPIASALLAVLLLLLYSYWIPQIWRNIKRGTSRGIRKDYAIGTTVLRLFFPVYAFACPDNIAFIAPTKLVWALVIYSMSQLGFLLLQDSFGARFFVPAYFLPPTYNYHPIIPPADEEIEADDGDSSEARPNDWEHNASSASNRVCAVCMQAVDIDVPTGHVLGRAAYMVTPCHHIFHTDCLSQWMAIKLECPVCRAPLPPI